MPQRVGLDILTFLQYYKMYPWLWNRNHVDFKNRPKREAAETALLPISGLSNIRELRQKIRNIRCTYNQELAKIKRSESSGACYTYKPKLVWFSYADSFLRLNDMDNLDMSKMETTYDTSTLAPNDSNMSFMKEEPPADSPISDQETLECISKMKPCEKDTIYASNYGSLAEFAETVETNSHLTNNTINNNTSMMSNLTNEFVVFGHHVAAQLQQLPLEEAIRLEEEIQSIITRARLRSIQT